MKHIRYGWSRLRKTQGTEYVGKKLKHPLKHHKLGSTDIYIPVYNPNVYIFILKIHVYNNVIFLSVHILSYVERIPANLLILT